MKNNARKLVKTLFLSVSERSRLQPYLLIVFAILLNGCGNKEMAELKRYTKIYPCQARKASRTSSTYQTICEISLYRRKGRSRDPFEPFSLVFLEAKHRRHLKTMVKTVIPKKY